MRDYPLLDLFLTMLWFFLWILWIFLLIRVIGDIFRSEDLGGWGKAGWTIFLIVVPYLGVLVYLIARGSTMHRRELREVQAGEEAFRQYVRDIAGSDRRGVDGHGVDGHGVGGHAADGYSVADQLTKLAALRDRGVLTEAEFQAQKARILV